MHLLRGIKYHVNRQICYAALLPVLVSHFIPLTRSLTRQGLMVRLRLLITQYSQYTDSTVIKLQLYTTGKKST